jgi:isoquinoline 1-oxidoreductase beta subunit
MRITRRGLLLSAAGAGGALLMGTVGLGAWIDAYDRKDRQQSAIGPGARLVTQWIRIDDDGHITLIAPHSEMGQGTQTSLLQILLDELDADPATTTYALAPAHPAFTHSDAIQGVMAGDQDLTTWSGRFVEKLFGRACELGGIQFTGGSMAVRYTGWRGIRRAAASTRAMLVVAASEALGVAPEELRTENSAVIHDATGRRVGYGALAAAASKLPIPDEPVYKRPDAWRYIGTAFPRIDIPEKVFGEPVYGIDVEVPGMRYAAVAPPPLAQGRVRGVANEADVRARRGVEAVVVLDDCVAVVADNPWRAEQAARALEIRCDPPEGGGLDHATEEAARLAAVPTASSHVATWGDAVDELAGADVVEATYVTPYYVHAPMEPLNATVWEADGRLHVATGAQGALSARTLAASTLDVAFEDVVFHAKTMGGGFGRRNGLDPSSLNWIRIACEVHNAVGGAVKTTFSREAGIRMSVYHPADAGRMQARVDADGRPTAWLSRLYVPQQLAEETRPPYAIPGITVRTVGGSPLLPYGFWRSVGSFSNVYFIESFIDELAEKAGVDPVAYRLGLLDHEPRLARTLEKVTAMAGWTGRRRGDRGYGVACAPSFGSAVSVVVEASLEQGRPRVHQVWCAFDCGTPVNPGSVESQVQGGIFWGLSAALFGELTFEDGAMVQSNLHDYRVATFHEAPRIHTELIVDHDAEIGGVGEASTPLLAPALANALAALAPRTRRLPLVDVGV